MQWRTPTQLGTLHNRVVLQRPLFMTSQEKEGGGSTTLSEPTVQKKHERYSPNLGKRSID